MHGVKQQGTRWQRRHAIVSVALFGLTLTINPFRLTHPSPTSEMLSIEPKLPDPAGPAFTRFVASDIVVGTAQFWGAWCRKLRLAGQGVEGNRQLPFSLELYTIHPARGQA